MLESSSPPNPFLSHPISTAGPMARTPTDLRLMLETMAGPDRFNASLVSNTKSIENVRIGWLADWGGSLPFESGIIPLCAHALDTIIEEIDDGFVELISKPPFDSELMWNSWTTIRSKLLSDQFLTEYSETKVFNSEPPLKPEILWEINRGIALSNESIEEAKEIANEWNSCVTNLFTKYDVLALPSTQVWPFPAEWRWPKSIAGHKMDTYHRWMQVVVPGTLAGLPCVTIPVGFNENGLPMGMYLMGPKNSDAKLLALAERYHSKIDWPSKRRAPIQYTSDQSII